MIRTWAARSAAVVASTALAFGLVSTPAQAAPAEPPEDLRAAVQRDLGLSWDDYVERGRQAETAAALDEELRDEPGYQGVSLDGDEVVVAGRGTAVDRAARADQVRAERPRQQFDADSLRAAYADQVDADQAGLLGIGWTGEGWLLTVAAPDTPGRLADGSAGRTPRQFAAANPDVSLRAGAIASAQADILGGQGWGTTARMPRCSIGFAAFGPDGRQAMLTAGHCSDNGTLVDARWEDDPAYSLGRLAWTQFGSPANTANAVSEPGADLSAYAGASGDLRAAMDSYAGRSLITGSTAPVAGAPVCTSGRTTRRWQCSTIEAVGPYAVLGPGGAGDVRWIDGFSTGLPTRSGDSGAGMVTGLKAVGIVSAGGDYDGREYSFGASLAPALARGYTLEVWLNPPTADPSAAGRVRGRVAVEDSLPTGTTIRVESAAGTTTAAVNPDGTFDVAAPSGLADLVVASGPSRSARVFFDSRYGSATSGRFCGLVRGGCFQRFTAGSVYWSSATGEHLVKGRVFDRWGGMGWETGWLGYPTSGEMCGLTGGGCWQTFAGGRMYWSPASDAHPVRGAIGDAWNRTGFEHGFLGYPTSGEFCGLRDGGCFQRYQGGSFYWSPGTGAHWTRGAIRDYWGTQGWEAGRFGYPIGGESCATVGGTWTCTQRFAGGTITWTPAGGARG